LSKNIGQVCRLRHNIRQATQPKSAALANDPGV
jgi:hypothetical protein